MALEGKNDFNYLKESNIISCDIFKLSGPIDWHSIILSSISQLFRVSLEFNPGK